MQHIVSRNSDPKETLVITVASFNSGSANNIIPKSATITGTVRYYNHEIGKLAEKRFKEIIINTCKAYGARSKIVFTKGYPATINHENPSSFAFSAAKKVVGLKAEDKQNPMMGSEDFSYFLNNVPGAFAWIGNGKSASLHNPKYDFNDDVFVVNASREILIPGAIIPPLYVFFIITSNVVAVPKSKTIKLSLLLTKLMALVNLSEPTCL